MSIFKKWILKPLQKMQIRSVYQKHVNTSSISKLKKHVISYSKQYWKYPPSIVNFVIIVLQIIIYITQSEALKTRLEFQPSNKVEIWRYFTYSLIHLNWTHLLGNSLFQLVFGSTLEPLHGPKVIAIYTIGVISGSLLHAITNYLSSLSGASAGASALILAWASDVILNYSEQTCPIASLIPVMLFILWQFFMVAGMTSVSSHISGGFSGFLFGFVILRNLKTHQYERRIINVALTIGVLYIVTLIMLNINNIHT